MLLDDRLRPITDTAGLFERELSACVSEYVAWMQPNLASGGGILHETTLPAARLDGHLARLAPLVRGGSTRTLFVAAPAGWTACFTNGWRGTDVSSVVPMLSARLRCNALRVSCSPDIRSGPSRRFGARIVEFHRGNQAPERVISVANDGGKWVEYLGGVPLAQEDCGWFKAARVRDRFTLQQHRELVDRLLPGFWEIARWPIESAALVERAGTMPASFAEVDLEAVQQDIPTELAGRNGRRR